MRDFLNHAQRYVFRGFLAMIPIFLCYLAVKLLYELIDKKVIGFLDKMIDVKHIPGLGILLVLVILYFIGIVVSNFVGRKALKFLENISERIPLIKSVYSMGKQLSQSLDADNKKSGFKKAVLVDVNNSNVLVPGFVTGSIIDERTKEELTLVFSPPRPLQPRGLLPH